MARAVALLDANVLYPARLRDLLLRLAIDGQYAARCSEPILDECFGNLSADRPDLPERALARTRRLVGVAVPDAVVADFDHLVGGIDLPDPGDLHVVAAAIAGGADLIVTANLADFPASSLPKGMRATSPDVFVLSLIEADIDSVLAVVESQAASLRNPPMAVGELLDGLAVVGLARSADALRQALGRTVAPGPRPPVRIPPRGTSTSDADRRVPQELADDLDRHAFGERQAGRRVAQLVRHDRHRAPSTGCRAR